MCTPHTNTIFNPISSTRELQTRFVQQLTTMIASRYLLLYPLIGAGNFGIILRSIFRYDQSIETSNKSRIYGWQLQVGNPVLSGWIFWREADNSSLRGYYGCYYGSGDRWSNPPVPTPLWYPWGTQGPWSHISKPNLLSLWDFHKAVSTKLSR